MPTTLVYDAERGVLVARAFGTIVVDDLTGYLAQPLPPAPEGTVWRELVDLTDCTGIQVSADEVDRIALHAGRRRDGGTLGLLAILAPTDLGFGLARMYEVVTERLSVRRPTRVCRTRQEALAFLDLPPDWAPPDLPEP